MMVDFLLLNIRGHLKNEDTEEKELNEYNRATFYGGGEVGYTDYPFLG